MITDRGDATARQRLIERARGNHMPPHPEPLRTAAYWRERYELAVRERDELLEQVANLCARQPSCATAPEVYE